jgi:copper homeostasis protein
MIRPRIGSFTYTEDEIETMVQDILALKSEGVTGFVFGCLLGNNTIDLKRLKV